MGRALHAQHYSFKLKPIAERHAVLWQVDWKRDDLESRPCCPVYFIKRGDTAITARQKVLPETPFTRGWLGRLRNQSNPFGAAIVGRSRGKGTLTKSA